MKYNESVPKLFNVLYTHSFHILSFKNNVVLVFSLNGHYGNICKFVKVLRLKLSLPNGLSTVRACMNQQILSKLLITSHNNGYTLNQVFLTYSIQYRLHKCEK